MRRLPPEDQCPNASGTIFPGFNSDLPTGSLCLHCSPSCGFPAQHNKQPQWIFSTEERLIYVRRQADNSHHQRPFKGLAWRMKRISLRSGCYVLKNAHLTTIKMFIASEPRTQFSFLLFSFFVALSTLLSLFFCPFPSSVILSLHLCLCGFPLWFLFLSPPLSSYIITVRPSWALRDGWGEVWLHYQAGLSGLFWNVLWQLSDWHVAAEQGFL